MAKVAKKLKTMRRIDQDALLNKKKFPPYKDWDPRVMEYVVGEVKAKRWASPSKTPIDKMPQRAKRNPVTIKTKKKK
jgi:hypothetical protein